MKILLKTVLSSVLLIAAMGSVSCDQELLHEGDDTLSPTDTSDTQLSKLSFWQTHKCYAKYTFVSLGDVPEPNDASMLPAEIDNSGNICGFTDSTGFYWTEEEFIDILAENNAGFSSGAVRDCSNNGKLTGEGLYPSSEGHYYYATVFIWTESGGMVYIGKNVDEGCYGRGINDNGDVVMQCTSGPYVWSEDQGHVLIPSVTGSISAPEPESINDDGVVVGVTWDGAGDRKPFIWSPEIGLKRLMDLGGRNASALDINNEGQMVGSSDLTTGYTHPVFWEKNGNILDLGLLEIPTNLVRGEALAINDLGVIVGRDFTPGGDPLVPPAHPWVWCGGEKYGLNDGIIEDFEGWHAWHAYGVNDDGEIAVQAVDPDGNTRAIKVIPKPASEIVPE